ncbi:MAG: SDR family oxidoreductase [Actinomycetia bacterium]|nr:SDR family oxidoreductase [Actinomycetes bacterium]
MDLGIEGKKAAVAAGSGGLGYAVAAALAAEGVDVAICGRDEGRLTQAVASLGEAATGAWPIGLVADVSNADGATDFVEQAADNLGGQLDILVCNAGGPPPGFASQTDIDQYRAAVEMNCLATIALAQAAVGPMRERGWGRILGITSIGSRQPIDFLAASNVARAGVAAFLKLLSTEVAPDGVTVNNLQPGTHRTDRVAKLGGDQAEQLRADIPAGDLGDAADFGSVAAMMCSQQARFVTGVGLHIDGGAFRGLQ